MGLPGTTDSSVYQGLKDVLQRYPVVTTVTYDDDHPGLGPVHFQYHDPLREEQHYECARFKKTVPTEILWAALDRLFEHRIPTLTGEL